MPLSGDWKGLTNLKKNIAALKKAGPWEREILGGIAKEVRGLLSYEFASGVAPSGVPWQPTVRGKQPLDTQRLASDFKARIVAGAVIFYSRIPWLSAHQEGHTFSARHVADRKNVMRFSNRGRLVKAARFDKIRYRTDKKTGQQIEVRNRGRVTFARAHTVSARILPARPMAPEGELPELWQGAVGRGVIGAVQRWYTQATR